MVYVGNVKITIIKAFQGSGFGKRAVPVVLYILNIFTVGRLSGKYNVRPSVQVQVGTFDSTAVHARNGCS